ncbi:hypothetical protein BD413DRAFT_655298 [Trametes elegans]|nr:hypothetical protein BD413DRAFT_655298 [Trametes elegans]
MAIFHRYRTESLGPSRFRMGSGETRRRITTSGLLPRCPPASWVKSCPASIDPTESDMKRHAYLDTPQAPRTPSSAQYFGSLPFIPRNTNNAYALHTLNRHLELSGLGDKDQHDGSTVASHERHPHHAANRDPNTIQLTPISDDVHCFFRSPGPFSCVGLENVGDHGAVDPACTDLGEILHQYESRIDSLHFDLSSYPNHNPPNKMVHPLQLPFFTTTATSMENSIFPIPTLSHLTELEVLTSRAVSYRSLLNLLRSTPVLRSLSVVNESHHQAVLPEYFGDVPTVDLSHLESVKLNGILSGTVDEFFSRLTIKTSTRIEVHIRPASPSVAITALKPALVSVRHVRVSYTTLGKHDSQPGYSHTFTFSDIGARVKLHWYWTVPQDHKPNVYVVSLDPTALAGVRALTVSLQGTMPTFSEWFTILSPYPSLRRVELHVTSADTRSSQTATFVTKAAPVLGKVADVRLVFALGLARHCGHGLKSAADTPLILGSPLKQRFYHALWAHMVRKTE